jgi:hypothetical protein
MCKKIMIIGLIGLLAAAITCGLFFLFYKLSPLERSNLVSNSVGQYIVLPNWHSLRKLTDIIHFPFWLQKSNLETYYLEISKNNLMEMEKSLPIDPKTGSAGNLTEDDKTFVNAVFEDKEYPYKNEVKVRYGGIVSNNWTSRKKALMINFPAADLFQGAKNLKFFLPDDRGYFMESLNAYRAKKIGLIAPDYKFIKLVLNGEDMGVYLAAEVHTKQWLAKNNIYDTDNIFSPMDQNLLSTTTVFSSQRINDWKSYTAANQNGPFEELNTLIELVENASDKEFAEKIGTVVDLEKFYNFMIITTLAGSNHLNQGNVKLLFKQENGKFEMLVEDVEIFPLTDDYYSLNNALVKRILSAPKFFNAYKEMLKKYTADENNLKDDLKYYNKLYSDLKNEFYRDHVKIQNDIIFENRVDEIRGLIISNFQKAKDLANLEKYPAGKSHPRPDKKLSFEGSFKFLNNVSQTSDEFISQNPNFYKRDGTTLILKTGIYTLFQTIIIPENLKLVIEPGTTLLFAPDISFISYSPVTAVGTAGAPISFLPLYPDGKPWGSFGVINTGSAKNIFVYINVSGGSEALINGVLFTSQFSLNNTLSEVTNSVFENGKSDDGLHGLLGSVDLMGNVFKNSYSDGIDFDYVSNAKISNNLFFNDNLNGKSADGDGLDISGAVNLLIENNKIFNFTDKCISVGENSSLEIKNNILSGCNYGIAVKDNSSAVINNDIIVGNKTVGVALYRKKPEFIFGGRAEVFDSIIWGNNKEISKDETTFVVLKSGTGQKEFTPNKTSSITVKNSTVKGGFIGGENILTSMPDFKTLLPAYIFKFAEKSLQN